MPQLSEQGKVRCARIGVIVFGISAYVIALFADGIYELVATASAFGSAGIFVVGMFGLFSRVGGPASAYAALVVGMGVWGAGTLLEWSTPYVAALACSLAAYLAGATVRQPVPA
jgi:Na+/proline symporter